mgnify:FL=1
MCHQYAEHYLKWLSGLEEEIEYWKLYMEEKGGVSFYGFEETISSNKHFVLEDDIPAEYIGKEYHFLDVGSGPFSRCGRITDKVYLDALSVDPLAGAYNALKRQNGIDNGIRLETGFVELLNRKFDQNSFDMVHMSNSLDHCFDAIYGIYQLLYVCKVGGTVILRHSENEAEKAGYSGLHQWNLSLHNEENTFLIWRNDKKYNIPKLFGEYAEIELYPDAVEGRWKYNKVLLKKKKDIVLPKTDYYGEMFQNTYDYLLSHLLLDVKKRDRRPMTVNELACKKIIEIYDAPEKFIKKLQCEDIKSVDIYGIGEVGSALYHLLEKCGVVINQVIDREKKTFCGKRTIPIEIYQPDRESFGVIVTIYNDRAAVMDLLSAKMNQKTIISIDDFLHI